MRKHLLDPHWHWIVIKKWRSIERLDAPSICKCNVNVKVGLLLLRISIRP